MSAGVARRIRGYHAAGHQMVVVVTGDTQNGADQRKPTEFLYSHILKAVRR